MPIKKKVFKLSLSSQIVLITVGIIFLFGSIAAVMVYSFSTQNLLAQSKKDQLNLTIDKAKDVETLMNEIFSVSKQISNEKILRDTLIASSSPTLLTQATSLLNSYLINDLYSTIYVLGSNGTTLVSTDPMFVGKNYGFRPYFTQAMQGKNYVDIGLGITTKKLGYYFSHPIYQGNKIIGVCVIKTDPQKIDKIVDYAILKVNAQTLTTDDSGVVIYSSKPGRLYMSLGDLSPTHTKQEQQYRFPGITEFKALDYDEVQTALEKKMPSGIVDKYDTEDAKREIITYSAVGPFPFYSVIEADSAPYISTATSSAVVVSLLVLAAAAVASLIIAIFVRNFLSPISKLVYAADEIGRGNLSVTIPSFASLEFSHLAESFKKMAFNLQDLYANLEKKVSIRTQELDERNKKLNESESVLKDALETSERANKLMVGRELEMVELKKTIKTLKENKLKNEN